MRAVLLIVLGAFLGPAWGQWDSNKRVVLSQVSGTEVKGTVGASGLWNQVLGRTIEVNGGTGYVKLKEPGAANMGPGPRVGSTIPVAVERGIVWGGMMRTAARALPLIGTALAIKDLMDAIRCREATGGGGECDPGQNETTSTVYCVNSLSAPIGKFCGSSPEAAHASFLGALNALGATLACGGGGTGCFRYQHGPAGAACTGASCDYYQSSRYVSSNAWGGWTYWGTRNAVAEQGTACPNIVVNGVTLTPVKGPDGKCATNVYEPASEDAITTKGTAWGDKTKGALIAGDLIAAGKPIPHDPPVYDAPPSQTGTRETTVAPDGTTTVKDWDWVITDTPDGYKWQPRLIEKTYPPGAVIPAQGSIPDGTTTTGAPPGEEKITCGLPGTPPCKIDETGTPVSGTISKEEVDTSKASGLAKIGELGTMQAPAWTWSFALPAFCSPINVGPFFTQMVTVDLCDYQSMIHDLVALIWAAFTVWACVGMVGRTFATG